MSDTATCSKCGRSVPQGRGSPLGGGCPYCLLSFALGDDPLDASDVGRLANEAASSTTAPIAALPERIGPYRLLDLVGRGGMGSVYRARHESLGRTVALKVLHPEFAARPGFPERFQREGRLLAALDHPHIIGVHDVGCDGGFYYLAMEFVAGSTLRERMHAGPLPVAAAVALFNQMCDALQYAHERGLVHRDIKPENILLAASATDAAETVKIADFGVAKLVDSDTVEGPPVTEMNVIVGTRRYMAPEQLEPGRPIDHRADLYALGVVLYEMLTGELPLGVFAPPSRKAAVDARLDETMLAALAKDPQQRPADARTFRTQVEMSLRPQSKLPRRTVLAAAAGGAALAIAGVTLSRRSLLPDNASHSAAPQGAIRLVHPARVWGVAFAADGRTLATSCDDRLVRFWDLDGGEPTASFTAYPHGELGYLSLAFSPDGQSLATAGGDPLARIWDLATRRERFSLKSHSREIVAVAYSPDGARLATAGQDRTVRLWNAADGAMIASFGPLMDPALCAAFSPDGKTLVAGLMNGAVKVWNTTDLAERATLGHVKRVWSVAFLPGDEHRFLSGSHDGTIKLWDLRQKLPLQEIKAGGEVWSVAVSPQGDSLAVGLDDGSLRLWRLPELIPTQTLRAHQAAIVSVAFSPYGTKLATGGLDRSALVFNILMMPGSLVGREPDWPRGRGS
jgi:serine/threonine protein kinase